MPDKLIVHVHLASILRYGEFDKIEDIINVLELFQELFLYSQYL